MSQRPQESGADTETFVRREVWLALLLLALVLAGIGASGVFLRDQVTAFAGAVYAQLGFGGLALVLFVSETVVSPLPPDVILWVVATSELSANWPVPVTILALLSTLGGHAGWFLGRQLGGRPLVRRMLGPHRARSVELMREYGVWAVVLAALTPVPWSVTSWSAGALETPWRLYLLGSLARMPRMIAYYVLMHVTFQGVADLG
jgi:membrane protein YqaA with SNARE-associated domain